MNYFFGFGLMTCARSVENPSSINSWVKVLCALILYVLCISSIISMMLQLCLEASVCLVCSPYFSFTVCCDNQDNVAFKNTLLRFWDLQVWKWGEFLVGVDQVYAFDVEIAASQISSIIPRGHSQGRKSSSGLVSLGYCWEQPKSLGRISAPKVNTHEAMPAYSMQGSNGLPAVRRHVGAPELGLMSGQWQRALSSPKHRRMQTNKVYWSLQLSAGL